MRDPERMINTIILKKFGVKTYEKDSILAFRRKTVQLFVFVLRFYINVVKNC